MPRTFLPYMFFILMTSKSLHAVSSASESSSNGKPIFALKLSCDFRLSREMPKTSHFAFRNSVEVAELLPFGRAAGRIVFGIEVENDGSPSCLAEAEALASRCGKLEGGRGLI